MKYCSITSKSLVTRFLSIKKTASKTGLALITVFQEAIDQFNDVIQKCKCFIGPLFPVNEFLTRFLPLKNMESLGIDGALISDMKMINA